MAVCGGFLVATLTAAFNQGTNGNTIATSDTGNENAWDVVTVGAGGTLIYDNTHINTGSLAVKAQTAGATVILRWSTSFGTQSEHWGRVYLFFTANPAASVSFMRNLSGASLASQIAINAAGKIQVFDSATNTLSTNSISTGQLIRIEWHILHSATVGVVEAKLFNTASSTTATETITLSSANTLTSSNVISFGNAGANTAGPFWMDDIQSNITNYPGPLVNYAPGFFTVL